MSAKRNNFQLGLAVIVMFVLFVGCMLFIGAKGIFSEKSRSITVRLAAGPALPEISKGSVVTCFGQQVGKVIDTHFVIGTDPDDTTRTDVQFLEAEVTARADLDLRADCLITAGGPPLGGKGFLEISNRGVAKEPLADDAVIYAGAAGLQTALAQLTAEFDANDPTSLMAQIKRQLRPDVDDSLIAKIHLSLDNIATMTAALAMQVDPEQSDVLLAKVHAALDQVNVGLREVVDMVQETRPQVQNAMASTDHALQRIDREIVASLAEELDRNQDGSLLAQVHESMTRLNESLTDVNTITGETRQTVVLNTARIDQLVQNATEASVLLKRGVRDLASQPWRLLGKPSEKELAQLDNIDVAREFADAAAQLDDAAIRLKALVDAEGTALNPDSEDLKKIQEQLDASVKEFFKTEATLYKRLDKK
ncbi:MAG: hypothetical protein H6817_02435 [Phycisphaerales bacterium]|nr:hypothetical protein [Phycisphaerales bacterium]